MASRAQIDANRRNAHKSTGPKTVAGKQIVSRNALTHGLLSNDGIFLDEDPAAFEELSEDLHNQYGPVGEIEKVLVDGIIWTVWRLRRLPRFEAGRQILQRYGSSSESIVGYDDQKFRDGVTQATQHRYAPVVAAAPVHDRAALAEEIQQKAERNIENGLSARAWTLEGVLLLNRYEAKLDRRLRQLLAELEQFQMTRPPEAAIEAYSQGRRALTPPVLWNSSDCPPIQSADCPPIQSETPVVIRTFGQPRK